MKFLVGSLLLVTLCSAQPGGAAATNRASILFCSPTGAGTGYVDLGYLKELHAKGFEVDYTEHFDEFTSERFRKYNALVIFAGPVQYPWVLTKLTSAGFVELLDGFLGAGGGVFVMTPSAHTEEEPLPPELFQRWGVQIPVEHIKENDPGNVSMMSHMDYPLAFTDHVLESPVSKGVKQIWYPYIHTYNSQSTAPLWLDASWQPVVRASKTSATEPVDLTKSGLVLPRHPFHRPEKSIPEPPIFAVRSYAKGRIAFMSQWPQYSIGSGTKWLFHHEVLTHGLKGKPSDFGLLLENTYRWLAEPSLQSGAVGGAVTDTARLVPPNYRAGAMKDYEEIPWKDEARLAEFGRLPKDARIMRGIIGVKTRYGSGANRVEEYAAAAKTLGLDFLVVTDEFEKLTPEKLESLKSDCRKSSDDKLAVFPGYCIDNNIGNHLFVFGTNVAFPPAACLTGPDNKQLFQQTFSTTEPSPVLNWILSASHTFGMQFGVYGFTEAKAKGAVNVPDLRVCAMAAVRYYKDGKLVEDVTDDFLTAAQSTFPPGPMTFNEVRSVAELEREVKSNHSLTCARVGSLRTLFDEALRWTHQYDGINLSLSDGPEILAWPGCHRVINYGGQEFVTGRMLMPSRVALRSAVGLKEARIYNGRELYRRFVLNGAKEFDQLLLLEGAIQKSLVLVAEDMNAGKAVSYARRCWKDGAEAVVFCSDHVNDCKSPGDGPLLLAHGPFMMTVTYTPQVPDAGETWDGGPAATKPLIHFVNSSPILQSDQGREDGSRFNQTGLMEFSDELATAITSARTHVFDERVHFLNPWHAYGPIMPSKLFDYAVRFRSWVTPTIGPRPAGWAGPAMRAGIKPTLFLGEIKFKRDLTVQGLDLFQGVKSFGVEQCFLVIGRSKQLETVELTALTKLEEFRVDRGDWFGVWSPQFCNSHLFINRGNPLVLRLANPKGPGSWIFIAADAKGRAFKAGESFSWELFGVNYPLESSPKSSAEMVEMIRYLDRLDGLQLRRGKRVASRGILDIAGKDYVAELVMPKPKDKPQMTVAARVQGLNPRWSAGLWMRKGYEKGDYGNGENRYTPMGIDAFGNGYVPVNVSWADQTWLVAGHPVIADAAGRDLFIQTTHIGENPQRWHVSVNNPTDKPITSRLRQAMPLPGLAFGKRTVRLAPGEYRVLYQGERSLPDL
jgi:hypothetical protein